MTVVLLLAGVAWGGPVVGVDGGWALPLNRDTASDPGIALGALVGYRAGVGPVHLRPEAVFRMNLPADALAVGAGGAATFGKPVGVGAYAHVGYGTNFDAGFPYGDAGALVEVKVTKLLVAATVGWERMPSGSIGGTYECASTRPFCGPERARDWLVSGLTVALAL